MRRWLNKLGLFCGLLLIASSSLSFQNMPSNTFLNATKESPIDTIIVEKQKHLMTAFYKNNPVKTYRIALGFAPNGHKIQEGDGKTPEGTYFVTSKNPHSKFHLSLKLSYPSLQDEQNAKSRGINPGGNIMIHGLAPHLISKGKWHATKDWTLGCIAVTNDEIEELFKLANIGTKVLIIP